MSPHGVVTTSGGLGGGKRSSFGAVCSTIVSAIADGRILPFLIRWAMIRGDCASCKFRGKKVVKVRSQRLANKKLSNSPSRCTNRVQLLESFFIGNCCSQNFLRHLVIATAPSSKLSHQSKPLSLYATVLATRKCANALVLHPPGRDIPQRVVECPRGQARRHAVAT
jgi:hypothetical protein